MGLRGVVYLPVYIRGHAAHHGDPLLHAVVPLKGRRGTAGGGGKPRAPAAREPGPIARGEAFLDMELGYGPEFHLQDVNGMARWVCSVCDYEYNEEAGDPAAGIPPGTRFEDLPADWRCPECMVGKDAFVRVDEEVEKNDENDL